MRAIDNDIRVSLRTLPANTLSVLVVLGRIATAT